MFEAIITSIIGGGATGLLGVIIQRFADHKNKQLDMEKIKSQNDHEIALRKVDAEIMQQEWAARTQVAETEGYYKESVEDSKAFASSLMSEPQLYSVNVKPNKFQGSMLVILDFIRGLVRPGLTIYLCVLTSLIYFHAYKMLGVAMESTQAYEVLKLIIGTVLYLFSTCLLWWFGVRNKAPAPRIR